MTEDNNSGAFMLQSKSLIINGLNMGIRGRTKAIALMVNVIIKGKVMLPVNVLYIVVYCSMQGVITGLVTLTSHMRL